MEPKKLAEKGKIDVEKNTLKDKKEKAEAHISEVKENISKIHIMKIRKIKSL